jgi:hypothetical protein
VPTAAKPAATAASLATRFKVEVLGRTDFFDFAGRLAFVVLLVFDLLPARFGVVFDLTRRFDEVLDLVRFFAFFMIGPIRFNLAHIEPQSVCWQAGGDGFLPLIPVESIRRAQRRELPAGIAVKSRATPPRGLGYRASRTGRRMIGPSVRYPTIDNRGRPEAAGMFMRRMVFLATITPMCPECSDRSPSRRAAPAAAREPRAASPPPLPRSA